MIQRVLVLIILVPLAVILIALAAANRAPTPFTIDPFQPGNPDLTIVLPLFVWLFAALVIGVLVGSCATWLRQGRYRKQARRSRLTANAAADRSASSSTLPARS